MPLKCDRLFLFYSLTLVKQRSPKQTKWVFANRNPKKENLIFYFWIHNQEAYYNLILSLLRSIHLIEILPFRNWSFAVANHKVVGTLFDCYMCVLGSKQTTKTFLTDMMTLSWFEWSNNTSHEKQEISLLMIKKAWTRLKSSSSCFTLAVWHTFLESRNQNHPPNLPYKTEVKSTEGPYILGLQSQCMVNIEGYSGEMYLLGNPPGSWVLLLAASDHQKQPRKPLLRLFALIACCCNFLSSLLDKKQLWRSTTTHWNWNI